MFVHNKKDSTRTLTSHLLDTNTKNIIIRDLNNARNIFEEKKILKCVVNQSSSENLNMKIKYNIK